jgi:hypothetical protein
MAEFIKLGGTTGAIKGKSKTTGLPVELTSTHDDDGEAVLRIYDAAPHAFDPVTDSLRVQNNGAEVANVFPRSVMTANSSFQSLEAPLNAKACYFVLRCYGSTGVLPMVGLNVRLASHNSHIDDSTLQLVVPNEAAQGSLRLTAMLGINGIGDATPLIKGTVKTTPIIPQRYVHFRVSIGGTFAAGEGVDCEANVIWVV